VESACQCVEVVCVWVKLGRGKSLKQLLLSFIAVGYNSTGNAGIRTSVLDHG
jgi:hypothetical protein